ncbi:head completion adaptor [Vibrio phage 1.123.O._10N.286.48.F3]|nr:head completion adaptor [Vibrio phage 1.123.O._10N.286.48.F3]
MTVDEFKAEYPNITATDAQIQRYLDLFLCFYTDDYGCLADYLQGLFVAHRLYIDSLPGSPVLIQTTKKAGDVMVGGQLLNGGQSLPMDFSASRYGTTFATMIAPFGAGPMMAGEYYGS